MPRTRKTCLPFGMPAIAWGELHGAKPLLSIRHSNVTSDSSAVNWNAAFFADLRPFFPPGFFGTLVMRVVGAVPSTLKVTSAGLASWLFAGSTAATPKTWVPSLRDGVVKGEEQLAN